VKSDADVYVLRTFPEVEIFKGFNIAIMVLSLVALIIFSIQCLIFTLLFFEPSMKKMSSINSANSRGYVGLMVYQTIAIPIFTIFDK
jgi:hypothetical protein